MKSNNIALIVEQCFENSFFVLLDMHLAVHLIYVLS